MDEVTAASKVDNGMIGFSLELLHRDTQQMLECTQNLLLPQAPTRWTCLST